MIVFNADVAKKTINVEMEGLPQTKIRCEDTSNDVILATCQLWLDTLKLTDVEYQVIVRLH